MSITSHPLALVTVLVLIVAAIVVLSPSAVERAPGTGLAVGDVAPVFTLKTLDGQPVSLSDFTGKKAVWINFWASWCPFCVDEFPLMKQAKAEHAQELEVLAVNLQESPEAARRFAVDDFQSNFPVLLDPTSRVKNLYAVRTQPVSYLVNKEGRIAFVRNGPILENEVDEILGKTLSASPASPVFRASGEPVIMETDGVKHLVPLDEILSGGPPKDGIPSIDDPKFISPNEADWLTDDELVLGLNYKGQARAYPFQVMVWHEIVNDRFGDERVAVTYCPLCLTGIAFKPIVNGQEVEFGTSGKLHNSNLVMYDRLTESYWSQVTGQAIVGEAVPQKLERIAVEVLSWKNWKQQHPDTKVLSRDTGFLREYGSDPYGDYYTTPGTIFPLTHEDTRLPDKERVYGLDVSGAFKAYPDAQVAKAGAVNDVLGGVPIAVFANPTSGSVKAFRSGNRTFQRQGDVFVDQDGGVWSFQGQTESGEKLEEVVGVIAFWFSWAATHPDTDVYAAS